MSGVEAANPELLALASAAFEADGVRADALAVVAGAFDGARARPAGACASGDGVIIKDPSYMASSICSSRSASSRPGRVEESSRTRPRHASRGQARGRCGVRRPRAQNPYGSAIDRTEPRPSGRSSPGTSVLIVGTPGGSRAPSTTLVAPTAPGRSFARCPRPASGPPSRHAGRRRDDSGCASRATDSVPLDQPRGPGDRRRGVGVTRPSPRAPRTRGTRTPPAPPGAARRARGARNHGARALGPQCLGAGQRDHGSSAGSTPPVGACSRASASGSARRPVSG